MFPAWTSGSAGSSVEGESPHREVAHLKVDLGGVQDKVALIHDEDDSYRFVLSYDDGTTAALTPEEFAALLHQQDTQLRWWNRFFNITSAVGLLWVGLGLLGQVLFTGRMLVQWLVSERQRRSVVPPVFWWLSLTGASMLLAYFVWRRDVVGVLGQSAGWIIYARNLWLIYRSTEQSDEAGLADQPPAGELRSSRL